MVIKVYVSSVSGSMELTSRKKSVERTLEMAKINFNTIDISQDANAEEYKFMLEHATQMGATSMCPNPKVPLPPQIFNEDVYCGDYNAFDAAVELGELKSFLKLDKDENNES
ncbi:SH3 domain-binding glutamic acid-rich protein homolog [Aethina tumida]|uniref:SH3 domain-binding glutamic acid-rich protein homolog n=1 Tax=Aethina tumida TaxID=116153 RepID=UPI00214748F9|nr:SH3 domain-binding glutamic acid-rich protein homolog [Aethina tumida]